MSSSSSRNDDNNNNHHEQTKREVVIEDIPFTLPNRLFHSQNKKDQQLVLKCIDCHAGGEPARVVLSGVPSLPHEECSTALLKRSYMMKHLDHLRKILLLEPRGYPCQNVNFVFLPQGNNNNDDDNNNTMLQYVIAEQNKIYPLMSGHNTICVCTALLECGVIPMVEPMTNFTIEAPAGPIAITAKCQNGKAQSISFRSMAPSFVEHLDITVHVPHGGIGPVQVDVAYGGMWYAIVDIHQFQNNQDNSSSSSSTSSSAIRKKLQLDPEYAKDLCRIGEMIKVACREQFPVQHPTEDYPGCDILAFRDSTTNQNAVIMSNTELDWEKPETWTAMIDRSPCGTGTCAIMATLHARGLLQVGETFEHTSIVGSTFTGTILEETLLEDGRTAILPQIEGSACITQFSQVVVDKEDPFSEGYRVGDIW